MSHAVATSPATETKWTIVNGSMKGSVRLMNAAAFTIGRSPENEFVIINDPKCSRKHASVQWTAHGCEITGLNDANPVLINGKNLGTAILNDYDVVTLGETEVQFNLTTMPKGGVPMHTGASARMSLLPPPTSSSTPSRPRTGAASKRPQAKANTNRFLIYGVLGVVVMFLVFATTKKPKDQLGLRTEQQIQADIETANKLQEAAQNLPIKKMDESITSRQAQENFVRGFRDYRKGQFERSLDSFQACLALNPEHTLCNRYIRLAQRRFSELVQYSIVLGRKYRDQNQFKACRSSFHNVMAMVKDANSPAYKEAKANYDACNALAEGRF